MRFYLSAVVVFLALALPTPAQAAAQAAGQATGRSAIAPDNSKQPLVITAKQTLEWHRNDLQYIARGDVVVTQGPTSINADTVTADYRADAKSNNDIYQLTAIGNVRINSMGTGDKQETTASGDKAVYDVDKGLAVMTGRHLLMTSPDQTVTAKDRFEYWTKQGKLSAIGNAHAIHGEDTIDADSLSALFTEDPQTHKRVLTRMEAQGHVIITTPTEVLNGDRGDYIKATNIAHLYGHVTIKRGPNVLEGDSADVDMNTNISRMHAGTGPQSRVRGVFYPGTQNDVPSEESPISNTSPQVQPNVSGTTGVPAPTAPPPSIFPSASRPATGPAMQAAPVRAMNPAR